MVFLNYEAFSCAPRPMVTLKEIDLLGSLNLGSSPKYPANASLTISAARDKFQRALLGFFFFW